MSDDREVTGILRDGAVLRPLARTAACLDELTIAEFVTGALVGAEREHALAHLATCAFCRSESRASAALLADPDVMRASAHAERLAAGPRVSRRWMWPAGAAAAVLLAALWLRTPDSATRLREVPDPIGVAPRAIAPVATVLGVDSLRWTAVPRAEMYRVRLHDADGLVLWRAETSDSAIALPDSVHLAPRATYFWKVEALTEWRRWAESGFVEFRIAGSAR